MQDELIAELTDPPVVSLSAPHPLSGRREIQLQFPAPLSLATQPGESSHNPPSQQVRIVRTNKSFFSTSPRESSLAHTATQSKRRRHHSSGSKSRSITQPLNKVVSEGDSESESEKPICRYGAGCTHIADAAHNEKFSHPSPQELTEEQLQTNFICNECGFATKTLESLQFHLQRKTAWSNTSLIGSRVECLLDGRQWCEGVVTQYHHAMGKHRVEFFALSEPRWLVLSKHAFHISRRFVHSGMNDDPVKEKEEEASWDHCEPISLAYAFAQSCLFKVCGNTLQETGHLTRGHLSLSHNDKQRAQTHEASMLYGELLPRGVHKALCDAERLCVYERDARVLCDLGMGTGKVVLQAFLECRTLTYCYGVELSQGRYRLAEEAALRLVELLGAHRFDLHIQPGRFLVLTERESDSHAQATERESKEATEEPREREDELCGVCGVCEAACLCEDPHTTRSHKKMSISIATQPAHTTPTRRILHIECGDMFVCAKTQLCACDVLMIETDIPLSLHTQLYDMLTQLPLSARVLSYLQLDRCMRTVCETVRHTQNTPSARKERALYENALSLRQVEANRSEHDRYATSWSVHRGHHFYLWEKIPSLSVSKCHKEVSPPLSLTTPVETGFSAQSTPSHNVCLPWSVSDALARCLSLCSVSSSVSSPVQPALSLSHQMPTQNNARSSDSVQGEGETESTSPHNYHLQVPQNNAAQRYGEGRSTIVHTERERESDRERDAETESERDGDPSTQRNSAFSTDIRQRLSASTSSRNGSPPGVPLSARAVSERESAEERERQRESERRAASERERERCVACEALLYDSVVSLTLAENAQRVARAQKERERESEREREREREKERETRALEEGRESPKLKHATSVRAPRVSERERNASKCVVS